MTSTVTFAPARNPVPLIVTAMGRAVEPVDGEIAVTLGAVGTAADGGVGPDGDRPSQAATPNANANSHTPRRVLVVTAHSLLTTKRERGAET
jgi:hypothetical protein